MTATEKKLMRKHRAAVSLKEPDRSIYSKVIFVLLCAVPIFAMLIYGAVDLWAAGLLSLASAAIVVLWIADSLRTGEIRLSASSLQLPVLGLVLIGCVQLLPFGDSGSASDLLNVPAVRSLSLDPYATRFFLIRLVTLFIFFAAALLYVDSRGRMRKLVFTIIIFGAAMAFFGILQRLASPEAIYGLRATPQAIAFGPFVNQHHFAAFMEMTAGLTLGLLFGGAAKKDKNALLGIAVVLMMIAVILTGSRGGVISFMCVAGFVAAVRFFGKHGEARTSSNGTSKLTIAAGGAAVMLLVVGAVLYFGGGDQLIRGFGLQETQGDVTSGRTHFWGVAVQIFLANPIIGAGFDAFAVAFTKYDTWNGFYRVEQAHNDYLQMLADAGVLGFAFTAAFIFLLFKKSKTVIGGAANEFRRSVATGSLAGCFGILIHSFFDFPLRTPSNAFFFLLLAVLATVSIGNSKQDAA